MRIFWLDYIHVKNSGLFDERYYLRTNPDLRQADVDPLTHYLKFGYREGRNPSAQFVTSYYLEAYPDVRQSGINPLLHYLQSGQKEGRQTHPSQVEVGQTSGTDRAMSGFTPLQPAPNGHRPPEPANLSGDGALETEGVAPVAAKPPARPLVTSKELVFAIDTNLPEALEVGKGAYLLIKGWCFAPGRKIVDLHFTCGEKTYPIYNRSIYREDVLTSYWDMEADAESILHSGFWGLVRFDPLASEESQVLSLCAALENGTTVSSAFAEILLQPCRDERIRQALPLSFATPKVAICMATYNPPLELFKQQIQSIKNQTHQNWICIISDDHSRADAYDQICSLVSGDPRFFVFRNEDRLGHYYNFEAALRKVPQEIDFIAFADQDDEWYPNKLEVCLEAFKSPQDNLVFSDMDVMDSNGNKLSNTFWFNRQNNYTSLQTLLYANTVTGAASLFRSSLLPELLPFPQRLGDQYHDHWVACVAMAKGNIQYVAQPLYAYKQHGSNAYGIQGKIEPYTLFPEFRQYIRQLNNIPILKHEVKVTLDNLEGSYNFYLLRLILLAKTLLLRLESISTSKKRIIQQVAASERGLSGLLAHASRYELRKGPSLGYELLALRSAVGHRMRNLAFRQFRHTRIHQLRTIASSQAPTATINPRGAGRSTEIKPSNEEGTVRLLKQMMSPLLLDVSASEPARVNIIMATVDFNYIFGGYLAMFNLAKKIGQFGHKPRILIVEPCDYKPDEWRRKIQAYPGLEDLFDWIETSYHFDRSFPLKVNPEDIFISTSCWTSHIASQTARLLNNRKFIFFAQEYEPIFFPMGSMQAFSNQSYFLPQFTIFSTELLRQYFRNHKIGVYRHTVEEGDLSSISFNNAINKFDISIKDISERKKKKFLFYARPEAHAARNLYELGLLSLEHAISKGAFSEEWEFYGIGTIGNNRQISLGNGQHLTLLPKVSLKEYLELIPTFDLGMSLMLSPHPSLVPLEMAVAGMPVITNTYENKTAAELQKISTNLIGVEPTMDGIAEGLRLGALRVHNYTERMNGTHIHWPTDWEQVFDQDFKAHLEKMMREC